MANQRKKNYVSDLNKKLAENTDFIMVGFASTTHKKLEEIRLKLQEFNKDSAHKSQLTIIKNSLFKIAVEGFNRSSHVMDKENQENLMKEVKGQSALFFLPDDWMSGLKAFYGFLKDDENLTFKIGLIEGKIYDDKNLKELAELPGREELIVKVIMSIRSPQSRLVRSLQYNAQKLVYVLKNAGEIKH